MPALFIGHGSPINAIADNDYSRAWAELGRTLPRPRAILCISAHWEAAGAYLTAGDAPPTIHEFYGYPQALHELQYRAPGSSDLARRVVELLAPEYRVSSDATRGFDHGAWTVVAPMYPQADIPLVELSLDMTRPGTWHYAVARRLRPLRDEGVLILGSGNIVHNLSTLDRHATAPYDFAWRFNEAVKTMVLARDHAGLANWTLLGRDAALSVPTAEHYLPLLYAVAQHDVGEPVRFLTDEVASSMSMTSVIFGA